MPTIRHFKKKFNSRFRLKIKTFFLLKFGSRRIGSPVILVREEISRLYCHIALVSPK